MHQRRQVAAGLGAQLDRPAEQHQPGRLAAGAAHERGQRHRGASQSSGTNGVSSTANSTRPSSACPALLELLTTVSTSASKAALRLSGSRHAAGGQRARQQAGPAHAAAATVPPTTLPTPVGDDPVAHSASLAVRVGARR